MSSRGNGEISIPDIHVYITLFKIFCSEFIKVFSLAYPVSLINLKDTIALKKENENIRRVIGKVMPGSDMDNKYIFYSAFNTKPGGGKTVDHYDITDKRY